MKFRFTVAVLSTALALTALSSSAEANVSGIREDGRSASGKTMYRVSCANGKTWRIYWANGQWYDGVGAQGGQSRNLQQQAAFLCK